MWEPDGRVSAQVWLLQLVLPAHLPELLPPLAKTMATEISSDTVSKSQPAKGKFSLASPVWLKHIFKPVFIQAEAIA